MSQAGESVIGRIGKSSITDRQLETAHHRRSDGGHTAFHATLLGYSATDKLDWIAQDSSRVPWNIASVKGIMPLVSVVLKLVEHLQSRLPVIVLPDWHTKLYPDKTVGEYNADRAEYAERALTTDRAILSAMLPQIRWDAWTDSQKQQLFSAMTSLYSHPEEYRDMVVDGMVASGFDFGPFAFQDAVVTMAMWYLAKPGGSNAADYWVCRHQQYPLDPPGNGPGFLSSLLAHWSYNQPNASAGRWISTAIQDDPGCIHRPAWTSKSSVLPQNATWSSAFGTPSNLFALSHYMGDDRPTALFRQSGALQEADWCAGLIAAMDVSRSSARPDPTLPDRLLSYLSHANSGSCWAERQDDLLRHFFEQTVARFPSSSFPVVPRIYEKLCSSPFHAVAQRHWCGSATSLEPVMDALPVTEAIAALTMWAPQGSMAAGAFSALAEKLVRCITSGPRPSVDKTLVILQAILAANPGHRIESSNSIDAMLFSRNRLGWPHLDHVLSSLTNAGYTPSQYAWGLLTDRLTAAQEGKDNSPPARPSDGYDNPNTIVHLGQRLLSLGVLPGPSLFRSHPWPSDCPGNLDWNCTVARAAHLKLVTLAASAMPDINVVAGLRTPYGSVLSWATLYFQETSDKQANAHACNIMKVLLESGADHTLECHPDPDSVWIVRLPPSHPYWSLHAQTSRDILTSATPLASKPSPRRLRL